ncbi:minor tail protein [Dinoroseobacter phage vB_DshS-R5C]|uniref:GTA-like protein n=1 Tax=Dinoroseobacter phage vB_DshS-R5C TaxID=1965368 RepID=A0A1V0DYB6_9CAUD|nr:minor tail protein [Dinoroseobacter phage vB_DshS-R5C]ARB06120.1 GTA-like protein [Dinoroseobacter phage vB_DshS-R5C]
MIVVEKARSWIGTPYRHQQKVKGAGCDCLGLLRGVYEEVTGLLSEKPPPYTPSWGEAQGQELMLAAAAKYLVPATEIEPGAVLVFRMKPGAVAKHCSIVTEKDAMVHAHIRRGVVEEFLVPYWTRRIAGIFKFPEDAIG